MIDDLVFEQDAYSFNELERMGLKYFCPFANCEVFKREGDGRSYWFNISEYNDMKLYEFYHVFGNKEAENE